MGSADQHHRARQVHRRLASAGTLRDVRLDYFCTESNNAILPKHVVGPGTNFNQSPYNALPVGIGPFRYTAFQPPQDVEMEANPYYWRGRAKLQQIVYKMVPDDNTDMTELKPASSICGIRSTALGRAGQGTARQSVDVASEQFHVGHLSQHGAPAVGRPDRAACDPARDGSAAAFQKIVLSNGVMTESIVPRVARGWLDLPLAKYDPAAAARMLDADGWKLGPDRVRHKNGLTLSLDIAIPSGYRPSATLAAVLQSDYTRIGIAATIHNYASGEFFGPYAAGGIVQSGKFDAALHSQSLGPIWANVDGVLTCDSIPPNGFNETHYCNHTSMPRTTATYTPRSEGAESAAAAFQRQIDKDAPIIVIYERAFLAVYDKRLSGYHPNSFSWWGDPLQMDI